MTALVILEGVVIALLVVLVAGLLRSHADILRRLHALDAVDHDTRSSGPLQITARPGSRVPPSISGSTPLGATQSIALTQSRGLVLLAFLSSGCSTCRVFWEAFSDGAVMPAANIQAVVVTKGSAEESTSKVAQLAPAEIHTLMSSQAWDDFQIPVSPYFVLVDASRGVVVGEGAASTWDHVSQLLGQAMADAGHIDNQADTSQRARRTSDSLTEAGIEPGHESLFRNPHGEN